jgi:hypothetical protein
MDAPERFAAYLLEQPYHPRSNKHSNALLEFLLQDLIKVCPRLGTDAAEGNIVYELNGRVRVGTSEWNADLLLGPPVTPPRTDEARSPIHRAQPATFRIACEAKSIMTEHHKAQRNRQRDLDAFHHFMHRYDQNLIVAGVTVINISAAFRSPLRSSATRHRNPKNLVRDAVELLRALPLRSNPANGPGLEANCIIVIDYDNSTSRSASSVFTAAPAPQAGDPLHWDSFVRRICDLYTQRWVKH